MQQIEKSEREAVLVEDAALIRMMGFPVLEALPSRGAPYERVDPFILLHEARIRAADMTDVDTKHPHRGFDNIWYILEGTASTGHTTGPNGAIERARLPEGALLALRTGRGAWHAESIGKDEIDEGKTDAEFRSVIFWVNLARKDKNVDPTVLVLKPDEIAERVEGDATVRVLIGDGSPVQLGTPGLDVRRPAAERRRSRPLSAVRVPGVRVRAGWRGELRVERRSRETAAARAPRTWRHAQGDGRHARHEVPVDGGRADRRDAEMERPVRGLGGS